MLKIKKVWKALAIAATLSTVGLTAYPVAASSSSLLDEITDEETTEDYAEDTAYSLLRGNNLNYGKASISKVSSGEVGVAGITQCHRSCRTVSLSLSLERKVNGAYATYKMWDFSANNVTSLAKSINVLVPRNYYYRVRGYHAASDGGTKESTSTLTYGILID